MNLLTILKKYNLKPDALKGQHFLLDNAFLQREVEYADVKKTDVVLEIGSGPGNLTQVLAESAKKVIAIEKSQVFANVLKDLEIENVEVICDDAVKVDFNSLGFDKCVSNIPYQISAILTEKLLQTGKLSVICYQREFAQKMLIQPGIRQRSRLSVLVQYYSNPEILEDVPRGLFYPVPLVDSALVRLVPKISEFKADDFFWKVVKACFMHKNQTVRNSVAHSAAFLNMSKVTLKGIDLEMFQKKVYELDISELGKVANYLRSL